MVTFMLFLCNDVQDHRITKLLCSSFIWPFKFTKIYNYKLNEKKTVTVGLRVKKYG